MLTNKEKEIFELLTQCYSVFEISEILNISVKTVRNHISNVIVKLDVRDRTQAILMLLRMDLLKL